jgi:peptidoglycan/xylan/chitin deacetylase (PgdA/CDA1 family)
MIIYTASSDVALAFDDGPNPKVTPRLLKVLADKGVLANFFLIGKRTEESPELAKQIANAGHEIGNHSYTHKRLSALRQEAGEAAALEEIQKGAEAIKRVTGFETHFFRPPYLDWSVELGKLTQPLYGNQIIMASTKSGDYGWGKDHNWDETDAEAIRLQASRIINDWADAPAGTILCLHDSAEYNLPGNSYYDDWMNRALPTLEALPAVIDHFHAKGFKFKKLSDMDLIPVPLLSQ